MKQPAQRIPVALWLTNPDAACWNIDARQRRRLAAALPRAAIRCCRERASR